MKSRERFNQPGTRLRQVRPSHKFGGRSRSTVRAPNQPDTISAEDWRILRLNIQPDSIHTIQDALAHFSQPQLVRVGQSSSGEVSQQVHIEVLPSVLVLSGLRQAMDDEINSLQESLLALKCRRNALAPISRLPPETLAAIFSFLPPSAWVKKAGNPARIRVTHVCRRWRETALNYPSLWSDINITKLTPAAMAEILARAQKMPLHLEVDVTPWWAAGFDTFVRQLEPHISHTRHLNVNGRLHTALNQLMSSAPTLEFLSLSHKPPRFSLSSSDDHFNFFDCIAPRLTSLELKNCDISWKSPPLKGLRTLKMHTLSREMRPRLEDWLGALDEMPQLETLILHSATPRAPPDAPLISQPSRAVTLPSLTGFHISASARGCALALAHLVLPALSWLHVDAKS
ncbi:hypothetical protein DFH94DRAFT_674461, partial [Russula ochroleuca]